MEIHTSTTKQQQQQNKTKQNKNGKRPSHPKKEDWKFESTNLE